MSGGQIGIYLQESEKKSSGNPTDFIKQLFDPLVY